MTDPTRRPAPDDEHESTAVNSGVDHDRQPGVPPQAAEDGIDDDDEDIPGGESFPASDPPSGW